MTAEASEVIQAGMALSPAERRDVALQLLESVDDDAAQAEVDAAWNSEIRRRVDEIRSGKAKMLTREEVDAAIEADLAANDS